MRLSGRKCREAVPCYANCWFAGAKEPEEFAAKATAAVEKGFKGLKWDPFGKNYRQLLDAADHGRDRTPGLRLPAARFLACGRTHRDEEDCGHLRRASHSVLRAQSVRSRRKRGHTRPGVSTPGYCIHETLFDDVPWRKDVIDEDVKFVDGMMYPSAGQHQLFPSVRRAVDEERGATFMI